MLFADRIAKAVAAGRVEGVDVVAVGPGQGGPLSYPRANMRSCP
ncbi:hypothetical protein ABH922_002640 [Rhodococcus sp. 27YEA15]